MGIGHHPVLVALPDGDRHPQVPGTDRESPVTHEGEIVVPPAGDALLQRAGNEAAR